MTLQAIAGIVLTLVLQDVLVGAAPGFKIGNMHFGNDQVFDNDYENVNSKLYNIITKVGSSKGKCMKYVTATGNGVGDVFELPCSPEGVITITSDKMLIYGSPNQDSFSLFSNSPSTMTVFQDNKCTERKYQTVTRKTFSEITDLSDEECTKIRIKINYIIEEEVKYLEVLDKHVDERLRHHTKNLFNPAKSSFKSLDESTTKNSPKPQNKPTAAKKDNEKEYASPSTSSEPNKQQGPLSLYSQFQQATKSADDTLVPVAVSHQETAHNGVTVTEQVTIPNKDTVTQQGTPYNGATDEASTANNVPVPVPVSDQASSYNQESEAKPVEEITFSSNPSTGSSGHTSSLDTYLDRLAATYSKLKTQVSNHVHKPISNDGWDFTPLNKFIRKSHL